MRIYENRINLDGNRTAKTALKIGGIAAVGGAIAAIAIVKAIRNFNPIPDDIFGGSESRRMVDFSERPAKFAEEKGLPESFERQLFKS